MKKLVYILTAYILVFLIPTNVFAEGEFSADYNVIYDVQENGNTYVTQKITLTNLKSDIYPKQYSIIVDTEHIRNSTARDMSGTIDPQLIVNNGKTQILLTFNDRVVGIGKKLSFTLSYEHQDIAKKNGTIWEIIIPGIADNADLGPYNVYLKVPQSFGPIAYRKPEPQNGTHWTKEQMLEGGISAAYGTTQFFNLNLKYYLENQSSVRKRAEIALPPDTNYQKVSIVSIEPKPLEINRDNDGNWLAAYSLEANSQITIKTTIRISISLTPYIVEAENIDESVYLQETAHWPINFGKIKQISQNLKTPEDIYNYTVDTLIYDYDRVTQSPVRKGALEALADPATSLCTEFTDLFIALARSAGIPARQVIGYAYTTNSRLRPLSLVTDVLHAWPEYYDRKRLLWVPVDPTWGHTTGGIDYFSQFDFNHIVFAINGIRDDYPYPAGSYRQPGNKEKILDIDFADTDDAKHLNVQYEAEISFPKTVASGLDAKGTITVKNVSGVAADNVTVEVITDLPYEKTITKLVQIPPYTESSFPIYVHNRSFFSVGRGNITVNVDGVTATVSYSVRPIHAIILVTSVISFLIVVSIWMGMSHLKSHPLRKRAHS